MRIKKIVLAYAKRLIHNKKRVRPVFIKPLARRRYNGTRKRATICSTIGQFLKLYFERGSIHGISYLTRPQLTPIERCCWCMLLIFMTFASIQIGMKSLDRFQTQSTVIVWEREYFYWNSTIAGISICPLQRLSAPLFDKYCSDHKIDGQQKREFFSFLESLANSTYRNFDDIRTYDSIDGTLSILNIEPQQYMELIYNLTEDRSLKHDDDIHVKSLSNTIYGFSHEEFLETWMILTEHGLCYMTNTNMSKEYSARYLIFGLHPEMYFKNFTLLKLRTRSYFSGRTEISINGIDAETPYNVYIHSSLDVMKVDNYDISYTTKSMILEVYTTDLNSEHDFRRHSIKRRKCRFQDETNLKHYPLYSRRICLQECRLNYVYDVCKCIPHFYPNRLNKPKPVCSYKALKECVAPLADSFIKLYRITRNETHKEKIKCNCLENCQSALVEPEEMTHNDQEGYRHDHSVTVFSDDHPRRRLSRTMIFTLMDLWVSIGSTVGLFLGFNILGAVEIVYYFTLRLLWFLRGYRA